MIHPDTKLQKIDDEIGYGVIATKKIPRGTITWVQDKFDKEFTAEEVDSMDLIHQKIMDKYSFRNQTGHFILCWDFGRFVNHSFKSNCMSTAYGFELAIRDINVGEELTDDYGYLNISGPFKGRDENTERKYAYPDDLLRYYPIWDRQVIESFPYLPQVKQPLDSLLSREVLQEIREVISGKRKMKSLLETYYDAAKQTAGMNQ